MGKIYKFVLVLVGILYVIWDMKNAIASDITYNDNIRVIVYGILINLFSHWITSSGKDKEIDRVLTERNLLQDLLLKRERLSSTKLKNSIKKIERSGKRNKKRRR